MKRFSGPCSFRYLHWRLRSPFPGRACQMISLLAGGAEIVPCAIVTAESDSGLADGGFRRDCGAVVQAGKPRRRPMRRDVGGMHAGQAETRPGPVNTAVLGVRLAADRTGVERGAAQGTRVAGRR